MNSLVQSLLGHLLVTDESLIEQAKHTVLGMYGLPETHGYFCGALPCSLMRKDLSLLTEMEYIVTEKTDGVRHLLLVFTAPRDGKVYSLLVDRGFRFYYTNTKFSDWVALGTLFDGEVIVEESGAKFYAHDLVCLGGKRHVSICHYRERMQYVVDTIRWNSFPPDGCEEIFQMLAKQIYSLSELGTLFNTIVPKLPHKSDGYILTPNELAHTGKKNKFAFKWKQPNDHTLDLKLDRPLNPSTVAPVGEEPFLGERVGFLPSVPGHIDGLGCPPFEAFHLQTWDTNVYYDFCATAMSPERWKAIGIDDPNSARGCILECRYNYEKDMWVPIARRTDKLSPNDVFTIQRTIETMLEGLTMEELLNISRHIKK